MVVVGSTMTDLIAYARTLPEAGETVVGERFAVGFGGKGANQAVMCALLGATVTFVGCVGSDAFGGMTLDNFRSFGIDVSAVAVTDAAASGAAPIWVDGAGENRIIVVPGANDCLDPGDVERAVRAARPDVVLTQLEIPEACVAAALAAAAETGAISVLNPAPFRPVDRETLHAATWVVPNRTELDGIARLAGIAEGLGLDELVAETSDALGANLLVTLGEDGAKLVVREGAGVETIPAPPANAIDTTGAGDAFVGAFAFALAGGASPHDAAAFGCACASASVEARGTQTSFPRGERLAEVKSLLHDQTETRR